MPRHVGAIAASRALQECSLLKENNKLKVHPAKVNKGVKKRARVEAEVRLNHVSNCRIL